MKLSRHSHIGVNNNLEKLDLYDLRSCDFGRFFRRRSDIIGRLFAMIVAVSGVSAAVFIYFFMTDLERFNRKAKIEAEVASVTSLFSERIRNAQILQDTYKAL